MHHHPAGSAPAAEPPRTAASVPHERGAAPLAAPQLGRGDRGPLCRCGRHLAYLSVAMSWYGRTEQRRPGRNRPPETQALGGKPAGRPSPHSAPRLRGRPFAAVASALQERRPQPTLGGPVAGARPALRGGVAVPLAPVPLAGRDQRPAQPPVWQLLDARAGYHEENRCGPSRRVFTPERNSGEPAGQFTLSATACAVRGEV
jgi:hypothetical protein